MIIAKSHQAKHAVIVIHEIYGVNEHMKMFCHSLQEYGFDVFCPNLLGQEKAFDYSQEALAYQSFMDEVGFRKAAVQIKTLISAVESDYQKVFLIGFSVGATIAWLCSEVSGIHGIAGYYGSRIRDYMNTSPKCPTLLFFPREEKSFHVDELIAVLTERKIKTRKFNAQHGFSDPSSPNYDRESSQIAFHEMMSFFNKG